jgi:hypothetical protein
VIAFYPWWIVPTWFQSAFSCALSPFGFDHFKMLTVDLLHEFPLGVWKDFLLHIIRILESLGAEKVQAFNERYTSRTTRHPMSAF